MQEKRIEEKVNTIEQIHKLVKQLNQYRHEYYNLSAPSISDTIYDHLYDQLAQLEESSGIIMSNSPTQSVGFSPVSELEKVTHSVPLLSLDKTKQTSDIYKMLQKNDCLLMLKLDGLTVKLCYEDGKLVQASTRGDGLEGELITHNIPAFKNVPLTIPYKRSLVISGEAFINHSDFMRLKEELLDSSGKPYRNARNLASGSARALNPTTCKERAIYFYAFNIIEGLDDYVHIADSRHALLSSLSDFGFGVCPSVPFSCQNSMERLNKEIEYLKNLAIEQDFPIDGLVLRYDSMSYSKSLGQTGHHFKDGIAYKFEDDTYETVFRDIEWVPSRSGEIAPIAIFDTVEIDGCEVSRASLHNIGFIRDLELYPNCKILVSKRNMIIPHVEENLNRGHYQSSIIPKICPCCGTDTRIFTRGTDRNHMIQTLHCDNPTCGNKIIKKFLHFAEKKAMNLSGVSEMTLEKLIELGYLKNFQDIYHLDRYRDEIINLDGFGEKSYANIWSSIEQSRNTTFVRYLVAMDIPLIGRTVSRKLEQFFNSNLKDFEVAALGSFDFTSLDDVGDILSNNIHQWFRDAGNVDLWRNLQKEFKFERKEEIIMNEDKTNIFEGCTIVATGKLENFTRDSINSKICSLGASAAESVTKKTDYLICGEKAGNKLKKAEELGVKILSEQDFLEMISA